MKVMLSCVGKQDPVSEKTGEEGAIVTFCRKIKPDLIYLFPTGDGPNVKNHTEKEAQDTKEWISADEEFEGKVKVLIRPINIDPTNYSLLLSELRNQCLKVEQELKGEEVEFYASISSGTPQMQASWLVLGNQRILPNLTLWQVANPLDVNTENRIREIHTTFLEEENIIARIKNFVQKGYFKLAAEESEKLKQLSSYSYRRDKANLMVEIFSAYECWDLIQWGEAHRRLKNLLGRYRGCQDIQPVLDVINLQIEYLAKIKDEKEENSENLLDLYFNALRRYSRRDYTDTLARFWRIYEGFMYWIIRRNYDLEPKDLEKSKNRKLAEELQRKYQTTKLDFYKANNFIKNHKENNLKGVMDFKVSYGKEEITLNDLAEKLRTKRNDSLVAHGMKPVSQEDAQASLQIAEKIFSSLLPGGKRLMENYPFKEEYIAKMILIDN